MIDLNIFRAYDIRGEYGKTLTDSIMAKIGYLIGEEGKEVAVGNDIRSSSPQLANALISGLLAKKSRVYYLGEGSFGQTFFSGLGKGIILYITASHLPGQWNGLKMCYGDGMYVSEEYIKGLRDKMLQAREIPVLKSALEQAEKIDSKQAYKKIILSKFRIKKKKVVVDCRNGSTALVVPGLLRDMGLEVISINDRADPEFGGKEPTVDPGCLQEMKDSVIKEHAVAGFAFDGDGDRCAVVDEKGRILTGNELGIVIGRHYAGKKKGKIINTVACSMVSNLLNQAGIEVVTVPVGHTFIGIGCKGQNALFGYEETGHIVLPEYAFFGDAVLIALKIMAIMDEKNSRLSELVKDIPAYPFIEKVFDIENDSKKFEIMKKLAARLKKLYKGASEMDGIKVKFSDGRALVRCSNTSPVIRLYAEALTEKRLKELEHEFGSIIKEEIGK